MFTIKSSNFSVRIHDSKTQKDREKDQLDEHWPLPTFRLSMTPFFGSTKNVNNIFPRGQRQLIYSILRWLPQGKGPILYIEGEIKGLRLGKSTFKWIEILIGEGRNSFGSFDFSTLIFIFSSTCNACTGLKNFFCCRFEIRIGVLHMQ